MEKVGDNLSYVLITPARNEEVFIEQTIKSVIQQTVLPVKWVIVSDGSTDSTDDIVKKYAANHGWIELVRMPERKERHFAGKVHAFNAGYGKVKDMKYGIIGSLDADISFDENYFEFLLGKFAENERLGVGGTPFREGRTIYNYKFSSNEHVSGACQLFRRECFEAMGGYVPFKLGGIDLVAVVTARMKGWQTRTFTEKVCQHNRKMGSEKHRPLTYALKGGYHDYLMGVHPVWQFGRSIYHMKKKPYFLWGCVLFLGYAWAMVSRTERPVSTEFVAFRRKEQMHRLKEFFAKLLLQGGHNHPT